MRTHKGICMGLAVLVGLALSAGPVLAEEGWSEGGSGGGGGGGSAMEIPLTMTDMTGASKAEIDLGLVPADGYFGLAPRVSAAFGMGDMVLGLHVPLAYVSPDEGDSQFVLGNVGVDFKYLSSMGGNLNLTLGGGLGVSAGFLELDDGEAMAHMVGAVSGKSFFYHGPESLVIRPLFFAGMNMSGFFAEFEIGSEVAVPIMNTEGRDTEADLFWGIAAGYRIIDMIIPMIEFKGLHGLTDGWDITMMWFSLGARLDLGGILPHVRLSLPLDDADLGGTVDVIIDVGAVFTF